MRQCLALPDASSVEVCVVFDDEAAVSTLRAVGETARRVGHELRRSLYAGRGVVIEKKKCSENFMRRLYCNISIIMS